MSINPPTTGTMTPAADAPAAPEAEPTLGALATRAVRDAVPSQLYELLQLALPLSIDLAMRGWPRAAGWSLAIAAFGVWGLADRWLLGHDEPVPASGWRDRTARAVRALGGTLAVLLPLVLLLELFLRALGNAPIS